MKINPADVYLYVMVRNDLASMNPGKAAAQACHAANFCAVMNAEHELYTHWAAQTLQSFGTTIVLSASWHEISKIVTKATPYYKKGRACVGTVLDPTYPCRDGAWTHFVPVQTAAYLLAPKQLAKVLMKGREIGLMP